MAPKTEKNYYSATTGCRKAQSSTTVCCTDGQEKYRHQQTLIVQNLINIEPKCE